MSLEGEDNDFRWIRWAFVTWNEVMSDRKFFQLKYQVLKHQVHLANFEMIA